MNFKGFDTWIPIFRGGKQRDSNGFDHDGDALIDSALAKFNASVHEPPAVIGHPKDNAPAYGWVEGLKEGKDKLGRLLLAKFKQVQPEFAQMVQSGLFKKRSSAFYPDGSLRHVGFLGAMPPAVKGLPDVAFSEPADACFEFSEPWAWNNLADVMRNLREYFIEKEGPDTANRLIPDWQIDDMRAAGASPADAPTQAIYNEKEDTHMNFKEKLAKFFNEFMAKMPDDGPASTGSTPPANAGQFSEADLEKARTEAAQKEREKVMAEFAESQRQTKMATLKKEISAFCDELADKGRITPATIAFGLPEIMFALAESDNQIEFGEKKEKTTAYERMKALLESATPLVTFKEVATRASAAASAAGTAGEKLDQLTNAKMKADKELSYSAAFAEVQKENPELAREYQSEFSGE